MDSANERRRMGRGRGRIMNKVQSPRNEVGAGAPTERLENKERLSLQFSDEVGAGAPKERLENKERLSLQFSDEVGAEAPKERLENKERLSSQFSDEVGAEAPKERLENKERLSLQFSDEVGAEAPKERLENKERLSLQFSDEVGAEAPKERLENKERLSLQFSDEVGAEAPKERLENKERLSLQFSDEVGAEAPKERLENKERLSLQFSDEVGAEAPKERCEDGVDASKRQHNSQSSPQYSYEVGAGAVKWWDEDKLQLPLQPYDENGFDAFKRQHNLQSSPPPGVGVKTSNESLPASSEKGDHKQGSMAEGKGATEKSTDLSSRPVISENLTGDELVKWGEDRIAQRKKKALEEFEERKRQKLLEEKNQEERGFWPSDVQRSMTIEKIKEFMRSPITPEIHSTYFVPFKDIGTRSDPTNPAVKCISEKQMARMKQLIECFPDGIEVDYFLELYWEILGDRVKLNGYSFPLDDDEKVTFKLPIFWIPDNTECQVPGRILFPQQSKEKYGGSLKNVLQKFWGLFLKYMKNKNVVKLSDLFSESSDAPYFHALTGIWFSFKQWGLTGYVQFFEMLLDNFDPMHERFTVDYHAEEDNQWSRAAYLLVAGDYAVKFMEAVHRNFMGVSEEEIKKQKEKEKEEAYVPYEHPVERKAVTWRYIDMNHVALKEIKNQDPMIRVIDVVASGNIKRFQLFDVIRVKDIQNRDSLLKTIDRLVKEDVAFTVPDNVVPNNLIAFPNTMCSPCAPYWRRGIILRTDGKNGALTVLDVDTGEKKKVVPRKSVRNLTAEVFNLPVYNIPVRFSMDEEMNEVVSSYRKNNDADERLGKCLHTMLFGVNKGLRLKFHWLDAHYTHFVPGVWVVTGFLVDIFTKEAMKPRVSLSTYILKRFCIGCWNGELPGWEEENEDGEYDEYWGEHMPLRRPCIQEMIDEYFKKKKDEQYEKILIAKKILRRKACIEIPQRYTIHPDVDKAEEDSPIGRILMDLEYRGLRRMPSKSISFGKGVSRSRKCRVALV